MVLSMEMTTYDMSTWENIASWVLLLLGGLPLLIYPFVVFANLMLLAGHKSTYKPPLFNRLMNQGFIWGSFIYPAIYIPLYKIAIQLQSNQTLIYAALPVAYLALLAVCFRYMNAPLKP
ncbi:MULTISPECIES: hypothetical protein [Shewanella]|uniref:hypothetical protein n=1 Tax=Shewanella TaxID=22 RepID=UPI00005FDF2A|nr:conserved hypothetical protein [Shewanella sp. W3-18-1]